MAYWSNASSDEVELNRVEFSISLSPMQAHVADWYLRTLGPLVSEHVRGKCDF